MKFQEAEKKLIELAKGKYCKMLYENTIWSEKEAGKISKSVTCTVYIDSYKHCSGQTWEEALEAMRIYIKNSEQIINPEEAPE